MKSEAAIALIGQAFHRIAKHEDVVALDAYAGSQEFHELFSHVAPRSRPAMMRSYAQFRGRCLAAKPVKAPGSKKGKWPANRIARLRASWAKHGGNTYRVARDLHCTEKAAAAAAKRHLGAAATVNFEKPPRMTQDARFAPPLSRVTQEENAHGRTLQEAA